MLLCPVANFTAPAVLSGYMVDGTQQELRQLQAEYGEMLFDRYMRILTRDPDNFHLLRPCFACSGSTAKSKQDLLLNVDDSIAEDESWYMSMSMYIQCQPTCRTV